MRKIVQHEGARRLYRGVAWVAAGAGPAHAAYFTAYEQSKEFFGVANNPSDKPLQTAASGAIAAFVHEGTMNPIEAVKQRLQMHGSKYSGPINCVHTVLREEGIVAFYRSFPLVMLLSVPYQMVHVATYEYVKDWVNPNHLYDSKSHLIAGACGGAVASAVTNPADVAKTLLSVFFPLMCILTSVSR